MTKILIVLLLVLSIYASDKDSNLSNDTNYVDNPLQALLDASAYLDTLNSQANRDKAVKVYEESTGKMKIIAAKGLVEIYCSKKYRDEIQCQYWSQRANIKYKE